MRRPSALDREDDEGPHGYSRALPPGAFGRGVRKPRVRPLKASVDGPLKYRLLQRIVKKHEEQLNQCYRQGLDEDPNVGGKMVVKFVIGQDGRSDIETSIGNQTVDLCMTKVIGGWKFPKLRGDANVTVLYPFDLMN